MWVPWTNKVGYWWVWTGPKPKSSAGYDVLADARQRLEAQYQENDPNAVAEKWVKIVQDAPIERRKNLGQQWRKALALAQLRQRRIRQAKDMSDDDLVTWLTGRVNFDGVFPDKANLDEASRQKLFDEWRLTVKPSKDWNEIIQYTRVDFRRIGMELASLTALWVAGLVATLRS
jgi:hypothetical protein